MGSLKARSLPSFTWHGEDFLGLLDARELVGAQRLQLDGHAGEQWPDHGRGGPDGAGYHAGGPVTDYDPKTHKNNMLVNAQEGEVVMSRKAVKMMGRNFLLKANERANRRAA